MANIDEIVVNGILPIRPMNGIESLPRGAAIPSGIGISPSVIGPRSETGYEGLENPVVSPYRYQEVQPYPTQTQSTPFMGVGVGTGTLQPIIKSGMPGLKLTQKLKKGGKVSLAAKPVWDKDRPKDLGKPKSLSVKKKKAAKARAKAAGRPYPNAVDNIAMARKK